MSTTSDRPAPDVSLARAFLSRLDPEAQHFTLQTFDDTKAKRKGAARIHEVDPGNGALDVLAGWNRAQAGVFVTVNETDGRGRQADNVQRVRAVFVDLDGAPLEPVLSAALEPHIVVQSSPGRYHAYWLVDDCPLDKFEAVQRALAAKFAGDPSVHDLPRVMRLPGFLHCKSEPFLTRMLEGVGFRGPPYALAEIAGTLALDLSPQAAARSPADGKIATGGRHAHLFARGRSMAKGGMSRAAVRAALVAENEARCDPPIDVADIDYLAERAFSAKDAASWDRTESHRSHANGAGGTDTHADAQEAPEGDSGPPIDILRTAAAPPLRPDDVPPVLGRFAATQAQATGFDVSILIAAGIGAAAAMLTDEVRLLVDSRAGWFESGRLWLALVAGPGAGKSPGMKAALAPVFDVHREEVAKWAQAKDNAADEEPPMPALYVSDATTEALSEVLRANERGILYFTDELEAWLASHDAYRSAGGKDRGEWLRLYDGGPHQVNRVKRGAFFVKNWGASLLSATTPAALGKLASKLPTDGLLQRIMLVRAAPMVLPQEGILRVETRAPREAWDTALRRVYAIGPATVRLSVEAAATFATERAELHELTQAFEESSPSLAAHLAKRAAMLARLALVYHALEAPAIETPVSGETMARAARFMRRQERHAFAVYGLLVGADSGMTLAKDMARSILAGGIESFNRREIAHRCKAFRHADEPTRQGALTMLRDCGWIAPEGHPLAHGAQWHVDARVHELYAEHGEAARRRRDLVRARIQAREEDDE